MNHNFFLLYPYPQPGGFSQLIQSTPDTALGGVMHGAYAILSDTCTYSRHGVFHHRHLVEYPLGSFAESDAKFFLKKLREHGGKDAGCFYCRAFCDYNFISCLRQFGSNIFIHFADAYNSSTADHRIVAVFIPGGMAGDDINTQLAAFFMHRIPHYCQLLFAYIHRQIKVYTEIARRQSAGDRIGGKDMNRKPGGPFPAVFGDNKDRVGS